MINILALGLVERIINGALSTDPIAINHLQRLSGKVFRVIVTKPSLSIDVLFCDDHLRLEAIGQNFCHLQNTIDTPDCTLSTATISELLMLIKEKPSGNLPIKGDHKVLMQIKALADNFSPDVFAQLQNLIGKSGASYAYLFAQEISPVVSPILHSLKSLIIGKIPANNRTLDDDISQKTQALLRLQSDIEREQARLATLQNQP